MLSSTNPNSAVAKRVGRRKLAATAAATAAAALVVTTGVASAGPSASAATTSSSANQAEYGGTSGWTLAKTVNLTSAPAGTTYTTGVRKSTDQSYNEKSQATWGPHGLTVTAQRSGGKIVSADVMMRGVDVPPVAAIEMDVDMEGTGPGLGHAVWFRPTSGAQGEMDMLEYIGSNAGKKISGGAGKYESKSTLIRTGTSPYNLGSKAFGIAPESDGSYDGVRHYRYEFTQDSATLWVDGVEQGSVTKANFEKQNGAGSWAQFASGTHWYPRVTLQVDNGTSAKLWGTVPSSWSKSSINVSALRIYTRS